MKLKELKRLVDHLSKYEHDDDDVVVPIASPSIGSHKCVDVVSVHSGIDWDHGKVFLHTAKDLVVKTDKEEAFDMAVEFLMWIATKPTKRSTYEIDTAKSILDRVGIEYMKHQRFLHQDKFSK